MKGSDMPVFIVEQYELHAQRYVLEADNAAAAIKQLLEGDPDATDNPLDGEYIEVAEDYGLPAEDEYSELADALNATGVRVRELIPSIRSVEERPEATVAQCIASQAARL